MGSISKGILGGFSGKVGNVIGGTWKGIDYMRSMPTKKAFTPSEKQLEQQMKFALIMRFLQPMAGLLKLTFNDFAVQETGINNAFSYNYRNAITGTYPAFTVNYSTALVSRGSLPNVLGPSVVVAAGGVLTFSWTDNSNVGTASGKDVALMVAYCAALKSVIFLAAGNRSDMTADLNCSTFSGQVVETYLTFITDDGRTVANSIFTGEVTVS